MLHLKKHKETLKNYVNCCTNLERKTEKLYLYGEFSPNALFMYKTIKDVETKFA